MALRASKPSFNVREKLTELGRRFGLKGSELVEAETVQEARDLVSAGRKNLIYNGSMIINQRGNATGINVSSNYGIDRFFTQMENTVSGNWSIGQSTDVPAGYGFKFSLEYGCTTTSSNANRYLMTIYRMEGFDSQVFCYGTPYAKDVTLSFWIKCSKSGNIQVNFENEDNPDAGYQTKQTIHKSGTWEKKVVTIPGDTTKAFAWTNAKAMCFDIVYSAFGSTYNGGTPTAEWSTLSNNQRGAHCNIDLFNSTSDYVKITGVQLELGKNATEFEHRPYGEELALCQRYYFKSTNGQGSVYADNSNNSGNVGISVPFPVRMRATPSMTLPTSVSSNVHNFGLGDNSYTAGGDYGTNQDGGRIYFTGGTQKTVGTFSVLNSNAPIEFSAEI